jgi:hypothetical protein
MAAVSVEVPWDIPIVFPYACLIEFLLESRGNRFFEIQNFVFPCAFDIHRVNFCGIAQSDRARVNKHYLPPINNISLGQSNHHTVRAPLHEPNIALLRQKNAAQPIRIDWLGRGRWYGSPRRTK